MTVEEALRESKVYLFNHDALRRSLAKAIGCPSAYPPSGAGDGMPRGEPLHRDAECATNSISALQADILNLEEDLAYCRRILKPVIATMPPSIERVLLTNRYVEWLSMAETAEITGYEAASVYPAMKRAEEKLRGLDKLNNRNETK